MNHNHPFTPHCVICFNLNNPPWKPGTITIHSPEGDYRICDEHAAHVAASGAQGTIYDILSALQ